MDALEQGCWSGGGGSIAVHRLHRRDVMDLCPR
jgi:hypothetical protein